MTATVQAPGPVLVGVDGSRRNASAVAWATAEAGSSHQSRPLVLVHDRGGRASDAAGRATVDRAVALVAKIDPQLVPITEVVTTGAASGLVQVATDLEDGTGAGSSMVVVGRRGAGGFSRLSLGSTARNLVHQPGPPTVVVPSGWDPEKVSPTAPVVVDVTPGDDDGPDRAIALALARADRDGRPVVAVLTWSVDAAEAMEGRTIRDVWGEHADRAERDLEEALRDWRNVYPALEIRGTTTDRHPVAALLERAQEAELVVLPRGARGCAVVEYATCPVAVV